MVKSFTDQASVASSILGEDSSNESNSLSTDVRCFFDIRPCSTKQWSTSFPTSSSKSGR